MAKTNVHQQVIAISKSYHDSIEIYTKHFLKLMGVVLIPNLLTYFLIISLKASVVSSIAKLGALEFFSFTNINFIVSLLLILTIVIVQALGVIALTYMVVHRERVAVLTAFEHSLEFFWRFIGLAIVLMVITGIGLLLGFLLVILIGSPLASYSLTALEYTFDWLMLIPVIISAIITTFFVFASYSIVDKNQSITKGLQHSFTLVRGHFIPVAIRVLLIYIITSLLFFGIQFIPHIGNIVSVILVAPFSVVYLYILYNDLVKFKS